MAITKQKVIKRYKVTMDILAECVSLKIKGLSEDLQAKLKDAGEGLSQTIEWAVKYHISTNVKIPVDSLESSLPTLIDKYYLNKNSRNCVLNYKTVPKGNVDFEYLKSHKYDITNKSKHNGEDLFLNDLIQYQEKLKEYLESYITKETLPGLDFFREPTQSTISSFYFTCDCFEHADHTYILVADKESIDLNMAGSFSKIGWSVIIDFDRQSLNKGMLKEMYTNQDNISAILKPGDRMDPSKISKFSEQPLVYFANGYNDQPRAESYIAWTRKKYSKFLSNFLSLVAGEYTADKTIIVSLLDNIDLIRYIRDRCLESFSNPVFVISGKDSFEKKELAIENTTPYSPITQQSLKECIDFYIPDTDHDAKEAIYSLPYLKESGIKTDGILHKSDYNTLNAFMDVLYLGCEKGADTTIYDFFCGKAPLSWNLEKIQVVPRVGKYKKFYLKPLEDFVRKDRGIIFLSHNPGYGGTTVARQLAWDLHEDNPTVYIKKYSEELPALLVNLHQITRKTVVAFIEVPQIMSVEDAVAMFKGFDQTRPIVLVLICRNNYNIDGNRTIHVSSWGNDINILTSRFKPYLERLYTGKQLQVKQNILSNLIYSQNEYEKTPFYVGLVTFDREFYAIDSYIEKFANILRKNEGQKRVILYLSICDYYVHERLKSTLFKRVLDVTSREGQNFKLERYFSEKEAVVSSLLTKEMEGDVVYWRIRFPIFSEKLLHSLLDFDSVNLSSYRANLSEMCKKFIEDCAYSDSPEICEEILKKLFIGTSQERAGDSFTRIVKDLKDSSKLNIFKALHELYPQNPHFCSHLARFYANVEHNMEKAIEYADRAIRLSDIDDPLLHHIKGMCYRSIIYDRLKELIESKRNGKVIEDNTLNEIVNNLVPQAESEFAKTRELESHSTKKALYGYVANIQMLVRVLDGVSIIRDIPKSRLVSTGRNPYFTWIEEIQALLDGAKRIHDNNEEVDFDGRDRVQECENDFLTFYEDYSRILNNLNNMLSTSNRPSALRRMIVRTYMYKDNSYQLDSKLNKKLLDMMEQNIEEDPTNQRNYSIWFTCARYSTLPLDEVLEKVDTWKSLNPWVDTIYYCYVLNIVKALNGSSESAAKANRLIEECRKLSSGMIFVKDWYVGGNGMSAIIGNTKEVRDNKSSYLRKETGVVSAYIHEGRAKIKITGTDLEVFFSPTAAKLTYSCLNKEVEFYFGFSYDGPRADSESVKLI